MQNTLPPKPYARVRIIKYNQHFQPIRNVPLRWLNDWRRALDPDAAIGDAFESPANAPQFVCFYSPAGFAVEPKFEGLSHLSEWDDVVAGEAAAKAALYSVNVVQVIRDDVPNYSNKAHARVRLESDGTELVVPRAWIEREWLIKAHQGSGRVTDVETVWTCFYDPLDESGDPYGRYYRAPKLHNFRPNEKGFYQVKLLRVFEGECVRRKCDKIGVAIE